MEPQQQTPSIIPQASMASANQNSSPIPATKPKTIIIPEKDLAPQTVKYSIRTMAQDLERARKEGATPSAIKPPSVPPTPPPEIIKREISAISEIAGIEPIKAPKAPLKTAPVPQPPTALTPEFSPLPPPPAPIVPVELRPPAALPIKRPLKISSPQLKIFAEIIGIAIILIGSVGFSYWWFFIREAPIEPPAITQPPAEEKVITEELPPPIEIEEPILPAKISQTEKDLIIEIGAKSISDEMASMLASQISNEAKKLNEKESGRIIIKYSTETEKVYLSFREFLAMLRLKIPENFNQNLKDGEMLAYSAGKETRYGFIAEITDGLSALDSMKIWEQTILDDLKNLYIEKIPSKPQEISFKDDFQNNFIIRYINLPDSKLSLAWAISDEKKLLAIATSKNMLYKIIGYKEPEKPALKTFTGGTLVRAMGDTKIYRIIDDKKLWIPTVKAFIDSGYKPYSETEILPEELIQYQDIKYIKIKNGGNVFEIKGDKKYLIPNPQSLLQQEIKIATYAEFIAYPIGQ